MSVSKKFTKDAKVNVTFTIKKAAAQGAVKIDLLCEHNGWQGTLSWRSMTIECEPLRVS